MHVNSAVIFDFLFIQTTTKKKKELLPFIHLAEAFILKAVSVTAKIMLNKDQL